MHNEADKKNSSHSTVTLPREMAEEYEKIIKANESLGFGSFREFVKDAVRTSIAKYQEIELKNHELRNKRDNGANK
ncbi:MAG: hypothetical protein CVV28_02425 [Methanobacteriales archaeon HGW-Methanobacteriales-1]|jgi:metal-responsive CopG/Arc/MetJ family transcriptional regulator|nr:MAG: hypothetical protein CVV28_02425 [Methanobacteriales archaeon HGW-Methanobacteriales-1]